ncbi:MAG TPA: hypothetical protein VIJ38_08200 [Acidobacteriaceae bacterium]
MQRRDFRKLMAIAGASKAMLAFGQIAQDNLPALQDGFNRYIQDYATFCASPPEKRIFYANKDGRIARVELIGTEERVKWRQFPDGLHVDLPMQYRPAVDCATALKVTLA